MKELVYAIALIAIAMTSIVGGSIQSDSHMSRVAGNDDDLPDYVYDACMDAGGEIVVSRSHEGKAYCLISGGHACEIGDLLAGRCV